MYVYMSFDLCKGFPAKRKESDRSQSQRQLYTNSPGAAFELKQIRKFEHILQDPGLTWGPFFFES